MSRPVFWPTRLVLLLLVSLWAVAPGRAQSTTASLSKLLTKALDERYPHWAFATVTPPASACPAAAQGASAVVRGDFNGDGVADVALQITVGGTAHVVVALTRLDVPQFVDTDIPVGPLVVHLRGQRLVSPDLLMDSYYSTDTIGTDVCGSGDAWLWTGAGFRKLRVTR